MKREFDFSSLEPVPESIVTVGTFDGVHRGHQTIINRLLERADERDAPSTVITFDPPPAVVVRNMDVPLLTTVTERADILEGMGVDRMIVVPFTIEFSEIPPRTYVTDLLLDRVGMSEIVVGYDHRFGNDREGDTELLREMGEEYGFSVDIIPAHEIERQTVSSTAIREALQEGRIEAARELLGRPYELSGRVVRGEGRGRTIGYPTANIAPEHPAKLIPKVGVYAVTVQRTSINGARSYEGMMNIGRRPTFTDEETIVPEVHLFDCNEDLYGERLTVRLWKRMRDEKQFASVDELVDQLNQDEIRCREVLETVD